MNKEKTQEKKVVRPRANLPKLANKISTVIDNTANETELSIAEVLGLLDLVKLDYTERLRVTTKEA